MSAQDEVEIPAARAATEDVARPEDELELRSADLDAEVVRHREGIVGEASRRGAGAGSEAIPIPLSAALRLCVRSFHSASTEMRRNMSSMIQWKTTWWSDSTIPMSSIPTCKLCCASPLSLPPAK